MGRVFPLSGGSLKGGNAATDPFSAKGRAWMLEQQLPVDERLRLDAGLRQLDFLGEELRQVDGVIAEQVLGDADVRRLMTIPGIDVVTASTLAAVIGGVRRLGAVSKPGKRVGARRVEFRGRRET